MGQDRDFNLSSTSRPPCGSLGPSLLSWLTYKTGVVPVTSKGWYKHIRKNIVFCKFELSKTSLDLCAFYLKQPQIKHIKTYTTKPPIWVTLVLPALL